MPDIGTGVRIELLRAPQSNKNGWKSQNLSCREQVSSLSSVFRRGERGDVIALIDANSIVQV